MGVVDRTPEFRQLIAELTARGEGPKDAESIAANTPPQAQSELNAWSADIGTGIHEASLKVQELRKMSRQKGIFQDKSSEIEELTYSVKESLQLMTQKIEALERKAKGAGSNKNQQAHAKNLVDTLKTRLLEVTKDFKEALEDRTTTMEQQNKRRQMYSTAQGSAANPFAQRQRPTPSGSAEDLEGGGGAQAVGMQMAYHSSRAEAVQNVQKTIGELAQMFQKMAVLVTAQEEMIQRIDDDVDTANLNLQQGQEHLLKYFQYISSNRALIIKVFLILIFFVIFFVVFLA
mmetsp:Transcript_46529/g.92175  ORF Transcript_46529/g.92175 Transcript_46529/m.92175 type:complete len:289 (-) Transcript_46529:122-988(-)